MSTIDEVVIYRPRQETVVDDLMRMQTAAQDSVDGIVAETITDQPGYAGLGVVKTSGTVATVQPGRYYNAGRRYALSAAQALDLYSLLPSGAGSRVVSIVVSGEEVEVEVDTRNFGVSSDLAAPRVPQSVATRRRRVATAYSVAGAIGPAPVAPSIPSGYLEVARLTVDATGIVGDPVMVAGNRVPNMVVLATALLEQQELLADYGEALETLRSDLAQLAGMISLLATAAALRGLALEVAMLREKLEVGDDYTQAGEDSFATDAESDTGHGDYDAIIDAGVRFPTVATTQALALFTPGDTDVMISAGGLCLPAWDPITRKGSGSVTGSIRPKDYTVDDRSIVRLHKSRLYFVYGRGLARAEMAEILQETQSVDVFDPATETTISVNLRNKTWKLTSTRGSPHFFRLWIDQPYTDFVTTTVNVSGAGIAQTWRSGAVQWLTGLDVAVTIADNAGPLHLAVCKVTASGEPDLAAAIAYGSLAANLITPWPQFTRIPLEPTLLEPGERYAFVLLTTGNHTLGTAAGTNINAGTLFYSPDGAYWHADLDRDLTMRPVFAKFRKARTAVELAEISLSGGMRELHLAAVAVEPAATNLRLNGKIAGGGGWRQIGDEDDGLFVSGPDVTQLRAVFTGSNTVQAGIELAVSRLTALRRQVAVTHVSTARTLGVASTEIEVTMWLLDYDDAIHTAVVSLLIGGGYATPEAADSIDIRPTADPRVSMLTALFTPASLTAYKIKLVGTTSDATRTFAVVRRRDVAR
jgi:hypothetical protein